MERAGTIPGPASLALTGLDNPEISYVKVAEGFGVEARTVNTAEALTETLAYSFNSTTPFLIEANLG
jgi:thiamine pyrophosphate-dependent acetolactate synthase large subunit-like protein